MTELNEKKPSPPQNTAPLFVVGPLRSGTSLLYALLNQHSQIALMYECDVWFFPQMCSSLRFKGDWLARQEFYSRSLTRHRLVLGDRLDGLENVRTPQDLYRIFAQNKDARFFGEKSPFYCDRLGQLAKNHPGCLFILIWRDPLEIYRSIQEAARKSHYFRRRGMLHRLLFYQEKMIHEAAGLVLSGNRVHHITYADLIDRREESCRAICRFLEIEFDSKMTDLTGADLSAVFHSPQHEHLRRGVIERRQSQNGISPLTVQKLQRYQNRWNRLRREMFNHQENSPAGPEPTLFERHYHYLTGSFFCGMDSAIRCCFEFLPMPWLRTYRQAKAWFKAGNAVATARPFRDELWNNKATVLLSLLILAMVTVADYLTGVAVSLMLFYMIPASILTLVISRRWGTFAAVLSALAWAMVKNATSPFINFSHPAVWAWDIVMRFLVIETVVFLLARIRVDIGSQKTFRE